MATERGRGSGREPRRDLRHARVEALRGKNRVHEPPLERRLRVEARVEQHELHRAAQPEKTREKERRALRARQAGLAVGPLEARSLRREHEVAAIARPNPPAAATPSTAAMKGFGARWISEIVLWMYSRICLKTSP